ncbi:MAG: DUF4157 domain-containing protein, partial [Proteobacteria bacterium]|nr:DUF4157 domain-containing protein [Pseudomonadota bacterium]
MRDHDGGEKQGANAKSTSTPGAPGRDVPEAGGKANPVDRALAKSGQGMAMGGAILHTDGDAADAAQSLNAHAFAAGQDVYFGAGQYAPHTAEGQQLIAHEMAHVQQAGGVQAPTPGNYGVANASAPQEGAAREAAGGGEAQSMSAEPSTIYRAEIGVGVAANAVAHGKTAEQGATAGGRDGAQFNLLAARGAGADDADPLQAFRVAIVAGSKSKAIAKWATVPGADKSKLKAETDTLLRTVQVMGPKALDVLKDVGVDPTTDVRFAQEILWHGASSGWAAELKTQGWLTKFLQGDPKKAALDKKSLEHLAYYTGDAASAQDAFEKAYAPLMSGNIAMGTMTFHGQAWDQGHIDRLYKALQKGKIPPAHLRGSTGIWISSQVEDPTGSVAVGQDWGYYDGAGGIVMPLYAGAGTKDHDMVGAKKSKGPSMGHFASSALHEVGHLVGDQTGQWNWGTLASSPLQMAATTAADVQAELWDSAKNHALPKKSDPVTEADAKLVLEAEAIGTAGAYAGTAWALAGKDQGTFDTNLARQYRDQPLYKMAKAVNGDKNSAYTHPMRGTTSKDMMFAYLSRLGNTWAKYKKESYDQKVSMYSLSSPQEWFAEQYSYYMSTGGKATNATVKTKLVDVMKTVDTASGTPAVKSPGAPGGAADGGAG